jgi:hypothetical protein
VVERRCPFNSWSKWLEVPEIPEGAENGRGTVRYGLAKAVDTELLNFTLGDPWRDEESRHAATKTVELVGILFAICRGLGIREVIGAGGKWGRNMVVEATGLIEGKNEQSILPLWTSTERLIDFLEESLSIRDQTAIVHGGGANTTAGWVKVRESWQSSTKSIRVELGHGDSLVFVSSLLGPGERL